MSAAVLREAAALMRERAEAATVGGREAAWREDFEFILQEGTAAHVASWRPAAALAVADWLDATAAEHETDAANPRVRAFFAAFDTAPDLAALAVARAYLGTEATK